MVDTQRFAIWHPPGMPDNSQRKNNATVAPQQQTRQIPRNVNQVLQEYNWNDSYTPSTSSHRPGPSRPIQLASSPSSYRAGPSAPQSTSRTRTVYLEDVNEEDESEDYTSSEDEEPVIVVPAKHISPSRIPAPTPPVIRNSVVDRVKAQDRVQLPKFREPAKGAENKPVQPSAPFRGSAIVEQARALPMKSTGSGAIPQRAAPAETYTPRRQQPEPMIPSVSKLMPNAWNQWQNSAEPKVTPNRLEPPRSEYREPVSQPQPKVTPSKAEYPPSVSLDHDFGYLAYNSAGTLDLFLNKLQETALTDFKMSMMEASIRQFHLIAADADIQLTRELVSIKTQDMGDLRPKLIERHRSFLEVQARSVLDGLHGYHSQFWEKCLKPAHEEPEWEIPEVPVKKEPLPIPKQQQQQQQQQQQWQQQEGKSTVTAAPKITETVSEKLPEVWKPNFVDDSEPPTPKLGNVGLEDMFEMFQADMESDEKANRSPIIPPPAPIKPKSQPVRNQAQSKNTAIMAEEKPRGSSSVSPKVVAKPTGNTEKPPEKPALEPAEKPLEKPLEKLKPGPDTTAAKPVAKAKTAKELKAEKKKGKNKAAATGTRQTSDPLETAIEEMVATGNVDGMLEHMAGAWS